MHWYAFEGTVGHTETEDKVTESSARDGRVIHKLGIWVEPSWAERLVITTYIPHILDCDYFSFLYFLYRYGFWFSIF